MKTLGNVLWFIIFGLAYGVTFFLCGIIFCMLIITIPLGLGCFRIARLAFFPFKKNVVTDFQSHPTLNVIWLAFGGASTAVSFALMGAILCVTIIGIPFGMQCFKLMRLSVLPFGAEIV